MGNGRGHSRTLVYVSIYYSKSSDQGAIQVTSEKPIFMLKFVHKCFDHGANFYNLVVSLSVLILHMCIRDDRENG